MGFFILTVLSNISLYVLYKVSERLHCQPLKIALVQFISATACSLVYIYFMEGFHFSPYTLVIGIIGGLATYGAVHTFLILIRKGNFGLSTVITNLSISIPILVSIIIFREKPNAYTFAAFGLIILTFYLMAERGEDAAAVQRNRIWILLALASMLLSGIADSGPKIIQELDLSRISMSYLGYNYFFALLPTLGISIRKKIFPGKREWLIGSAMGVSILFSMFFLVMTLRSLPGTIVYPLNKTIVDVVVVLISVLVWKERLKLKQVLGVITAIAAIFLLNMGI